MWLWPHWVGLAKFSLVLSHLESPLALAQSTTPMGTHRHTHALKKFNTPIHPPTQTLSKQCYHGCTFNPNEWHKGSFLPFTLARLPHDRPKCFHNRTRNTWWKGFRSPPVIIRYVRAISTPSLKMIFNRSPVFQTNLKYLLTSSKPLQISSPLNVSFSSSLSSLSFFRSTNFSTRGCFMLHNSMAKSLLLRSISIFKIRQRWGGLIRAKRSLIFTIFFANPLCN